MTTAINVLQCISFSWALVLALVLIGRYTNRQEPPAELVAAIKDWPPPVKRTPFRVTWSPARYVDDPWSPPNRHDIVHFPIWTPAPEVDYVAWALSQPPHPWTRVGA